MLLRLLCASQAYRFVYFLVLFAYLTANISTTLVASPENLLSYQHRPTITDFLNEFETWPEQNPFKVSSGFLSFSTLPQQAEDELARLIALLELLFPGATFAPLGRDVVWFGDALDAFYMALGQKGRVSRLNASGPSFDGFAETNLRFLKDAGFDPANLQTTTPLVGFDRTSLSPGQLGRLFLTMYQKLRATYGSANPELVMSKLNIFTFNGANSSPLRPVTNAAEALALKQAQIANLSRTEWPALFPTFNYNNLNGSLVDSRLFWHDSFGRLAIINGKMQGSLGNPSNHETKVACLYFMFDIVSKVSTPQFLTKVKQAARNLGFEYPIDKVSDHILPRINFDVVTHAAGYRTLLTQLSQVAPNLEQPKYFSANGRLIANWFDNLVPVAKLSEKVPSLFALYIEGLNAAMKANQITSKDYRRLVAKGLASLDEGSGFTPHHEFVEWFREMLQSDLSLNKVWLGRASYFLDESPNRRGGIAVPRVYNAINKAIGLDSKGWACDSELAG